MDVDAFVKEKGIPKQVGFKLIEVAEGALAEALGRLPEPREVADMAEAMTAELVGGAYVLLRERGGGPQEAESWLRKTLAVAAAAIRMRGSDALVKIDVSIRDVPNRIAAKPPPEAAEQVRKEPAPAELCRCAKEADGRCPACAEALAGIYRQFFGVFREMTRFQDAFKNLCRPCQSDQLDYAVSTVVETLFETGDRLEADKRGVFANEVLALLYNLATSQGVKDMPLTVEAWKGAIGRRGITLEAP